MGIFSKFDDELRQLRLNHAVLQRTFSLVKSLYRSRKYDPDQPRVPAGNPDGGQWTGSAQVNADSRSNNHREIIRNADKQQPWQAISNTLRADGSIAQQTVLMRDGAAIRSESGGSNTTTAWDERHLVITPDGNLTVFENRGIIQTIKDASGNILGVSDWTRYGVQPEAFLQPVSSTIPYPALPSASGAAVTLFGWLCTQNSPDATAVCSFRGGFFTPGVDADSSAIWVGPVTQEQVKEACPRYSEVQSIADRAAELIDHGRYDRAQDYGTAVHKWIKTEINGPTTTPESPPRDPDFRAEMSFIKSAEVTYGREDSVRVDVYENPHTGAVCVHDIKTGTAPLSLPRMLEIATNVQHFYPGTRSIIVTEVRPRR